jgi:hypothetical protein
MDVGDIELELADLQPQFSISNPTAECDRNGDYYDSAGNVRGKACPISGALIRISGPRLTRHTLLDESPSIKMTDGYCYDKKAFISYLTKKLSKGIRPGDIKSPMTNVPYGLAELNEFQNAGLIDFENVLKFGRELGNIGEEIFDELIKPGFYYSFDNIENYINTNMNINEDNSMSAQNMDDLYEANQYLRTLGATEPIEYAKMLVIEGYLNLFNTVPRNIPMLRKLYAVGGLFMPFIRMNKPFSYYTKSANEIRYGEDFELIWENHPFFGRRFRNIFEKIATSCRLPTVFSGEMSLRNGKQIEHCEELYANRNSDSTQFKHWTKMMRELRQQKRVHNHMHNIGGKRQQKTCYKHKKSNKRRTKRRRKN